MATVMNQGALVPLARKRGLTLVGALVGFMTFFIIAFPKGGLKIYGIPITIGYIFTVALVVIALLRANRLTIPMDRLLAFAACLLLGLWSALVVAVNGTESFGFTLSYFTSVFYLPFFGLAVFSSLLLDEYHGLMERAFLWAVRFIVAYGIFLFLYRQLTGSWIEIPYLTVNVDDAGQMDDKYINRGGIFKLISTYNNGNIFGVSLAIMAPLYLKLESRRVLQWAMYAALFLTLSRTAWIAAVLIMAIGTLAKGLKPLAVLYLALGAVLAGFSIWGLLSFLGRDMSFVFDSNLGGRVGQLEVLWDIHIIPAIPVSALPEIVYLGALKYFGLPGLMLFIAHLLAPALLLMAEGTRVLSPSRASACLQGLLIYAIIAAADAAFSFIPVMMIFWMIAGMGLWYSHQHVLGGRVAWRARGDAASDQGSGSFRSAAYKAGHLVKGPREAAH